MLNNEDMVQCPCGRVFNSARLVKCPACGTLLGQDPAPAPLSPQPPRSQRPARHRCECGRTYNAQVLSKCPVCGLPTYPSPLDATPTATNAPVTHIAPPERPSAANYCVQCGSPLVGERPKFCSVCGAQVPAPDAAVAAASEANSAYRASQTSPTVPSPKPSAVTQRAATAPTPLAASQARSSGFAPARSNSAGKWWLIGLGVTLALVAFIRVVSMGQDQSAAGSPTVTSAEFLTVAEGLFPGCAISADRSSPITETAVTNIAFAQNTSAQLWCGAVYLYRDRAGFNAPGESETRDFWLSNAENNFGVAFTWLTCKNMKILLPQASASSVGGQMRDLGC